MYACSDDALFMYVATMRYSCVLRRCAIHVYDMHTFFGTLRAKNSEFDGVT